MPTFIELQQRHQVLMQKLAVLHHLIEYVDENFRPQAGCDPKQKLLDANNIPIPAPAFEAVVSEVLVKTLHEINAELDGILKTDLSTPTVAPAPEKKRSKN